MNELDGFNLLVTLTLTVGFLKQDNSKAWFANANPKGHAIHLMAEQMCHKNQDVYGAMHVCNNQGQHCLEESKKMMAWVVHYTRRINMEFPWNADALPDALHI